MWITEAHEPLSLFELMGFRPIDWSCHKNQRLKETAVDLWFTHACAQACTCTPTYTGTLQYQVRSHHTALHRIAYTQDTPKKWELGSL